jgi:formate-dependent nitrite reductase cytochrome c552 subunit
MARKTRRVLWIYWGLLSVTMAAYLTTGMLDKSAAHSPLLATARAMLVPGQTTHGHYQIELACESCHGNAFEGREAIQQACVQCHGAELKDADDKHPASKFDDPRNADRLEKLDAQSCATCHVEHRPGITLAMGVTKPADVCFQCHSGKDEMPPDHRDFKFDGCTAAGCHNYHDNRALYEDFLLKHSHEARMLEKALLPQRELGAAVKEMASYPAAQYPLQPLSSGQQDAPPGKTASAALHTDWQATAHAQAGVNCSGCHVPRQGADSGKWIERPKGTQSCAGCHVEETSGFQAGKHGMRLAQGLSAMTPGVARQPMKTDVAHRELGCTSCHGAHRFETKTAAVESCLGCHNDWHSLAYKQSPHYAMWQREAAGLAPAGSGVSCASCHMPRVKMPTADGARIVVQHNQNDTLRPNEKMIRATCMACHGLGFSIDALADTRLVTGNFRGMPSRHVVSIDMAIARKEEKQRERALGSP